MDLKIASARATDVERAAVESVLGSPTLPDTHAARGGHERRAARHHVLATLHAVNDRVGWVSRGAINHIAERLDVAPADLYGVATFYALFSPTERPARQVHVCIDLACRAAGGPREHDLPAGTHPSPCLGLCERAPAALVIEAGEPVRRSVAAPAGMDEVRALAAGRWPADERPAVDAVPQAGSNDLALLARIGHIDPASIDDYRAAGGYEALRVAIDLGPTAVIEAVAASGLTGRGGAAFPTGRKWDAVAHQPAQPHHLVCNADESEPGTFKDRVLMEGDPFSVIEAMTIAAFATGCAHGWLYLRGEYPRCQVALQTAIDFARQRGFLGDDVMGAGFAFDVTLVRGAGAYICGEETAIFNSIEGYRGEPRNKPPFPVEVGLFGKPTVVNNVETLVNVLPILRRGDQHVETKLFCVSGAVARPGVYEIPFGVTLGGLLDLAGGTRGDAQLRAVLLGGAAGTFVDADDLDMPLTLEATRQRGATLGSGVVLVLDDTVDLVDQVQRIAAFFRDESCGQCVPCRVGTVRQEEVVARLAAGEGGEDDLTVFRDLATVMRDASICGLGQTAPNAIQSAIEKFGVFQ